MKKCSFDIKEGVSRIEFLSRSVLDRTFVATILDRPRSAHLFQITARFRNWTAVYFILHFFWCSSTMRFLSLSYDCLFMLLRNSSFRLKFPRWPGTGRTDLWFEVQRQELLWHENSELCNFFVIPLATLHEFSFYTACYSHLVYLSCYFFLYSSLKLYFVLFFHQF